MKKHFATAAIAVLSIFCAVGSANASTVIGSACVSVSDAAGCKFSGNINGMLDPLNVNSHKNAEAAYNLFNNSNPLANPDITLNYLGASDTSFPGTFTINGAQTAGTWTLTGYLVDFVAVKAGAEFILYKLATPASTGNWSTAGLTNNRGNLRELSHLSFFGSAVAVPEPATWAMLIAGFGLVGSSMRRRRKNFVTA